jgi:hypothetical protein
MAEALDVQGIHIPMKVIVSFVTVDTIAIGTMTAATVSATRFHHHQHKNNHHPNPSTSENV